MITTLSEISKTKVILIITASQPDINIFKDQILKKMSASLKLPGFREGTAPLNIVEKNVDQTQFQTEFLDLALSEMYSRAAQKEAIRPVSKPEVQIKKFVPFSQLEFEVTTDVLGDIKLANYKIVKVAKPSISVSAKDVDDVIESLRTRMAESKDIDRPAKAGDQVVLDFAGMDAKGEPVNGADGKDYPLTIGSKTFIPGFEENIIGLKTGQEKSFELTFPKDYGLKALANKKVTFTVNIKKVQEQTLPKLDDEFASKCGPFKTVAELKADVKKQLKIERANEATKNHQSELVNKIVDKSSADLPDSLIEQQINFNLEELRRNLAYRGQTYEEFLKLDETTDEKYKAEVVKPQSIRQLKTSIILNEIAEKESLSVTPEELEIRMQLLKGQYASDQAMQAELAKSENRQEIAQRMLTEKVLELLSK